MVILGITHPISWNNAACILVDGKLVAMVEEERFNRIKHAPNMAPKLAINYCLDLAGVSLGEVDYVAIGFDRAFSVALGNLKDHQSLSSFYQASKWFINGFINELKLPVRGIERSRVIFVDHHIAHAASAFLVSGFSEANIISLDGSGGIRSGVLGYGIGDSIEVLESISNQSSWGLLYELVTEKLGFRRHSGEGKVMGLAAYGNPDPDGLPCIGWDGEIPTIIPSKRKAYISSLPLREKEQPLTNEHENLAATLQDTLERAVIGIAEWLHKKTGIRNFCLSGGTALNCSMNGKLASLPFVENIFVQPASHDAGTALGAALLVYVNRSGKRPSWKLEHAYWGPEYSNADIEKAIKAFPTVLFRKTGDIAKDTAQQLSNGKIVGWFQGRSEIGPRALGNRSILGNPSDPEMKDRINNKVKHREPWRPFAPSILEGKVGRYIDNPIPSPFMILAFDTKPEAKKELISAIHVDGTCRPQTVSKKTNPRYWKLINEFYELTRVPALLNTSFNLAGQPIVNSPHEAIDTFLKSEMDLLAIGDFIMWK